VTEMKTMRSVLGQDRCRPCKQETGHEFAVMDSDGDVMPKKTRQVQTIPLYNSMKTNTIYKLRLVALANGHKMQTAWTDNN